MINPHLAIPLFRNWRSSYRLPYQIWLGQCDLPRLLSHLRITQFHVTVKADKPPLNWRTHIWHHMPLAQIQAKASHADVAFWTSLLPMWMGRLCRIQAESIHLSWTARRALSVLLWGYVPSHGPGSERAVQGLSRRSCLQSWYEIFIRSSKIFPHARTHTSTCNHKLWLQLIFSPYPEQSQWLSPDRIRVLCSKRLLPCLWCQVVHQSDNIVATPQAEWGRCQWKSWTMFLASAKQTTHWVGQPSTYV